MPYQCLIGFLSAFLSLQSIILQGFLENLQRIFQGFLCFPLNRFDVNAYALLLPILRCFIERVSMKYIHILFIEEPRSNLLHCLLCMCARVCVPLYWIKKYISSFSMVLHFAVGVILFHFAVLYILCGSIFFLRET